MLLGAVPTFRRDSPAISCPRSPARPLRTASSVWRGETRLCVARSSRSTRWGFRPPLLRRLRPLSEATRHFDDVRRVGTCDHARAFQGFHAPRYPCKMEPPGGYSRLCGTDVLYDRFRNGFSHDLGLSFTSRSPLRVCLNRHSVQPERTWDDVTCRASIASAPRVQMTA